MTVMMYDSFESDQSIPPPNTTWQEVATKTGQLRQGVGNFILVSAEYGGTETNRSVGIRVLLNGSEKSFDYHTPGAVSEYKKFTDFGIFIPPTTTDYTISLEVIAGGSGQTVLVRRIRLMVFQV